LNFRTNNALVQTFAVNNLNEPDTVNGSGTLTVAGTTTSTATSKTYTFQPSAYNPDNDSTGGRIF
jgi:hypothetical protein